jgi:hypothetical protein
MREKMLKDFDKDGDGKLSDDERKAARKGMREHMVKEFDKDGDGTLSEDEREKMRHSIHKKRAKGKEDSDKGKAKRGTGDRRRAESGPDGPPRPRGPHGLGGPRLPSPEEMFAKFDADNNDSLSREEFKELTAFVHEHHPMGPPRGGPDGARFRGPRDRGPEFRHPDRPRDGDGPREFRRGDGPPRGDRLGPTDEERRHGWRDHYRDRDDRRPPHDFDRDRDDDDREEKAEKAEDESA